MLLTSACLFALCALPSTLASGKDAPKKRKTIPSTPSVDAPPQENPKSARLETFSSDFGAKVRPSQPAKAAPLMVTPDAPSNEKDEKVEVKEKVPSKGLFLETLQPRMNRSDALVLLPTASRPMMGRAEGEGIVPEWESNGTSSSDRSIDAKHVFESRKCVFTRSFLEQIIGCTYLKNAFPEEITLETKFYNPFVRSEAISKHVYEYIDTLYNDLIQEHGDDFTHFKVERILKPGELSSFLALESYHVHLLQEYMLGLFDGSHAADPAVIKVQSLGPLSPKSVQTALELGEEFTERVKNDLLEKLRDVIDDVAFNEIINDHRANTESAKFFWTLKDGKKQCKIVRNPLFKPQDYLAHFVAPYCQRRMEKLGVHFASEDIYKCVEPNALFTLLSVATQKNFQVQSEGHSIEASTLID